MTATPDIVAPPVERVINFDGTYTFTNPEGPCMFLARDGTLSDMTIKEQVYIRAREREQK